MAMIIGGAFGVALLGALFAFLLRRALNIALLHSYVAGVVIAMPIAAALYSHNSGIPFLNAMVIYGAAAPIAFVLLWMTRRRQAS